MPIVKTDVPMTYRLARDTAEEITCAYPVCRKRVLTATAFGREIEALSIGSGDRTVLFTAAHHANEWITATVLLKFAEELSKAIMERVPSTASPAGSLRRTARFSWCPW